MSNTSNTSDKVGSIEIKIRIRLDQDISLKLARQFVDELEYNVADNTGLVSINDWELIDDNVPVEDDIPVEDDASIDDALPILELR